jgi:tRNA (guanine-N7-)-methyltransferase
LNDDTKTDHPHDLRSFGRRRGRKLSPRQAAMLADMLPRVAFDPAHPVKRSDRPLWLEIGFGGGEHLIHQAVTNPAVDLIGCEPFEDGVVKVLTAMDEQQLGNITLHMDDAREVLRALPSASVDRAFVLFPDPWPKRKHQKRRLVSVALLTELARVLKPGCILRIGTDIEDYARTMLMAFQQVPAFRWTARSPQDWQIRPDDWPMTRYEAKAVREGRRSAYLLFERQAI